MAIRKIVAHALLVSMLTFTSKVGLSADLVVSNSSQLHSAFQSAGVGDNILLQPGIYTGGIFRANLTDVTVRSVDPANRAIIQGGNTNVQLSDAKDVTFEDLIFQDGVFNGLNFDDGGTFATPATNLTLRNIVVRRAGGTGNQDGIKLSGVNGFLIDGVEIDDWGDGGSAIDMVGSHNGLIQNSWLHTNIHGAGGSGIRPKGGTKNVTIRANRVDMPIGLGRGIQAGGSTGSQFFRFIDGDSGYEADNITAAGNVVIGGSSAFSWVNIDGGDFHHNYIHRPGTWTARILNENSGSAIVDTKNGLFHDNVVYFHDSGSEYNRAVNVGSETEANTFQFARNQWYNEVTPTNSFPLLPTPEVDGIYGVNPAVDPGSDHNSGIPWTFGWGTWLVNATDQTNIVNIASPGQFSVATPGPTGEYRPDLPSPFLGQWTFDALVGSQVSLSPFSQTILAKCATPGICTLGGDFNDDGTVDAADYTVWLDNLGSSFDLNGNGDESSGSTSIVDSADYLLWKSSFGNTVFGNSASAGTASSAAVVPEPSAIVLIATMVICLLNRRSTTGRTISSQLE